MLTHIYVQHPVYIIGCCTYTMYQHVKVLQSYFKRLKKCYRIYTVVAYLIK